MTQLLWPPNKIPFLRVLGEFASPRVLGEAKILLRGKRSLIEETAVLETGKQAAEQMDQERAREMVK